MVESERAVGFDATSQRAVASNSLPWGAAVPAASSWRDKLPDKPLLISGGVGGPFVIFLCTPLRNALTLGSRDKQSTMRGIYRKVFRGGPQAGWIGGVGPGVIACPQFLALGPVYHMLSSSLTGVLGTGPAWTHGLAVSVLSSLGASFCETVMTYGSQSRNAQMAYNNSFVTFSSVVDGSRKKVPLNSMHHVWGPGAGAMMTRNFLSVMSVRTLSPWLRQQPSLQFLGAARVTICDIASSVAICTLTAPVHQLFNFLATTPEARSVSRVEKIQMARRFLREQYFVPLPREEILTSVDLTKPLPEKQYSWRISRVAARDFGMRTAYVTTVFAVFMSIERALCEAMR
eukprot:TRINITY_DN43107_c0_g1_i1.p1 TRINITY_DN43107_c0_g1~~TRINITY_DN43107_c0_g1_i1.p1  ORF type:complete len:345 (+),score=46.50 TRINITY_DN43107_c0_g1_i1:76-1110(+)